MSLPTLLLLLFQASGTTDDTRRSVLGVAPAPDGSLASALDRRQVLGMYRLDAAAPEPAATSDSRERRRRAAVAVILRSA